MSIYNRANIFRQLQILTAMLNAFHQGPPIIYVLTGPMLMSALCLSTLVQGSIPDFMSIAVLAILLVDCNMILMVIFGQMATVYRRSCKILKFMTSKYDREKRNRQNKWEQRFYRSCSPLKIMISKANFVDVLTPLNCVQISIGLSVNLMLVK